MKTYLLLITEPITTYIEAAKRDTLKLVKLFLSTITMN